MKSDTGSLSGNCGTCVGGLLASELFSSGTGSSGAGVATILEEGLLGSAFARETGLDCSSLEVGREWSWDGGCFAEPAREMATSVLCVITSADCSRSIWYIVCLQMCRHVPP